MGRGAFRQAFESSGRPSGSLWAGQDRLGRRPPSLSLDHYRSLFDFAPDGFVATGGSGKIQEANRAAGSLLRVDQTALAGRSLAGFVCRSDRAEFRAGLTALRRAGRHGLGELRLKLQPAEGHAFDGAVTGARIPNDRPIVLAWSLRDIRRRTRVEQRLKESEQRYLRLYRQMLESRDELRVLAARSLHAREEEARRIARELHDEAGQMTASIHLALADIERELPARASGRLESVRELLDDLEQRLRRLSHELRPTILDDLGLGPALEFLAEGFAARTGISFAVDGTTRGRLEPVVETTVYRIVQEALTNIARHARAKRASIRLSRESESLRCSIRDDGVGLPEDRSAAAVARRRGLGLVGIRERLDALGGALRIRSRASGGTELWFTIPIRSPA
jgi:PAS domain S-box-containing protein